MIADVMFGYVPKYFQNIYDSRVMQMIVLEFG